MPVVANLDGKQTTITIDFDATDLFDQLTGGVSKEEVVKRVYQRAQSMLSKAIEAVGSTDDDLDKRATDAVTAVAETKAARPTGTLHKE